MNIITDYKLEKIKAIEHRLKLHPLLLKQLLIISKKKQLGLVLDAGFEYPYELYELWHLFKAEICIGVDQEDEYYKSTCSTEIARHSQLSEQQVGELIQDSEREIEFYNSYKLYVSLILEQNPLQRRDFLHQINLKSNTTIQRYLSESWVPYDVIIVSHLLSNIETLQENGVRQDWKWVAAKLISRLSPHGVIFFKIRPENFPNRNNISNNNINDLKQKLNVIHSELIEDNINGDKGSTIIIGSKKDT